MALQIDYFITTSISSSETLSLPFPEGYSGALLDRTMTRLEYDSGGQYASSSYSVAFSSSRILVSNLSSETWRAGRRLRLIIGKKSSDLYDTLTSYGFVSSNVPASEYVLALRASQAGYGNLVDQSPSGNDAQNNTSLFPAAYSTTTDYAAGVYLAPTNTSQGLLHKITTDPGAVTAGTEPNWATTAGGIATSGGAYRFTAEKGPWYVTPRGYKQFRSIVNTQISAIGAFTFPAIDFDLLNGDSLILNVQGEFNYTSGGATDLNEMSVFGNRLAAGSAGIALVATGQTSFNDLRLRINDGTTTLTSAHLASGFARKPGDGQMRTTTFLIDGQTKRMYCFADAVAMTSADYTGTSSSNIVAWDADISSVNRSTSSTNKLIYGGLAIAGGEANTTTYEWGSKNLDVLILKNRGLPDDIQSIANWFHYRGEALLPQNLLV